MATIIRILDGKTDLTSATVSNPSTAALIAKLKAAEAKAAPQLKTLDGTIVLNIGANEAFFTYEANPSTPPNVPVVEALFLAAVK
jgi:hypothetical protein